MFRDINRYISGNKRAFTLIEALTSTFIAGYVLLSVWGIYSISWQWWHEMAPAIEVQRIARIALFSIIDGTEDSTAGSESISGTPYYFRNGIAGATLTNDDVQGSLQSPVISGDKKMIEFKLENDATGINRRAFYLDQDVSAGTKAVYYRNNSGQARKVVGTELKVAAGDVYNLVFEEDTVHENIYKVTVRIEKKITGTKYENSPLIVECSEYVFCRNL
jgi:hypothetical protein